jgi:glycosyltransferase involved in cell wall biosynthesis
MPRYALIIPALDEAASIGKLLREIPRDLFPTVIVVDNGSRDGTADAARAGGADVIHEPRRGYGRACQAGLAAIHPETTAVAFIDADLSQDPADLALLVRRFEETGCDLAMGSRMLGASEPGALAPLQRLGNWLSTRCIRVLWGARFTDLGPLRMVSTRALGQLALTDHDFGWNVEMQAKAARLGLKVIEIPVRGRRRWAGKSKISGTLAGSIRAGFKILWTIYRCWRTG